MQDLSRNYAAAQRHSTRPHPYDHVSAIANSEGTIWNWREMIVKAAYGTLVDLYLPGGVRISDFLTMKNEIQAWLDTLTMETGAIIARYPDEWRPIAPAAAGYLLTAQGIGQVPEWLPPEGPVEIPGQWAWNGASSGFGPNQPVLDNAIVPRTNFAVPSIQVFSAVAQSLVAHAEIWSANGNTLIEQIAVSNELTGDFAENEMMQFDFTTTPTLNALSTYHILLINLFGGSPTAWRLLKTGTTAPGYPYAASPDIRYLTGLPAPGNVPSEDSQGSLALLLKWNI